VALVVLIIELPETSRNAAGSCRKAAQRREKFFGSFFQKRTAFFYVFRMIINPSPVVTNPARW
jgi:hypothetical protein